jgi:hypothetical protein
MQVLETGYKFIWQDTVRPDYIKYLPKEKWKQLYWTIEIFQLPFWQFNHLYCYIFLRHGTSSIKIYLSMEVKWQMASSDFYWFLQQFII